jgi:C4-dicarboxylate-specific signal transduction histidine kinase
MQGTPFVFAGLASVLLLTTACVWAWFTARKRNSERRASDKLAARVRVLEEESVQGILLVDGVGLIRGANKSARKMFGFADGEMLGKNIFRLTQNLPPAGSTGMDLEMVCKDGARLSTHCRAAKIPGPFSGSRTRGEETYLFFAEASVKSGGHAEHEFSTLDVAERVVNRIVKQLEGLLTTINGYTELALHETSENSPVRKDLEEIATASDAASSLTRHLLAFVGNQPIPLERVDVNALLESLQPKFKAVQVEVSAEHLYVLANRQCLRQIITVFCGSASHRAGQDAAKQIVTSRHREGPAEYAAISISDRGPALPPATLDCLFEPLFLDEESLGVELSAVYGMVKNLGGSIHVASDAGRGTTFEILIPLANGPTGENRIETSA